MAAPDDIPDLLLRLKGVLQEAGRLVQTLESRMGATPRPAVPEPEPVDTGFVVPEGAEDLDDDDRARISRYAPPEQGMKPHEYVFSMVQSFGEIDPGAICYWIDGRDTPANRRKLRNILNHLREAGRIKNVAYNHWRVRQPGERKG